MNEKCERELLVSSGFHGIWAVLGLVITGGTLLFVTLTGLAIWLISFSTASQVTVLFHTGAGLLLLTPIAYWQLRHWRATRKATRSASKVSAYVGFWLLAANLLSGAVITYQAMFNVWCSHFWVGLHRWTGILLVPFIVFHVLPRRITEPRRGEPRVASQPPTAVDRVFRDGGIAGCGARQCCRRLTIPFDAGAYLPPVSFRAAARPKSFRSQQRSDCEWPAVASGDHFRFTRVRFARLPCGDLRRMACERSSLVRGGSVLSGRASRDDRSAGDQGDREMRRLPCPRLDALRVQGSDAWPRDQWLHGRGFLRRLPCCSAGR